MCGNIIFSKERTNTHFISYVALNMVPIILMSLKTKGLIFISLKKEEKKMFCHVSIANDVDKLIDKLCFLLTRLRLYSDPSIKSYLVLCKNL
jgi:predicted glycosyltransferase